MGITPLSLQCDTADSGFLSTYLNIL